MDLCYRCKGSIHWPVYKEQKFISMEYLAVEIHAFSYADLSFRSEMSGVTDNSSERIWSHYQSKISTSVKNVTKRTNAT